MRVWRVVTSQSASATDDCLTHWAGSRLLRRRFASAAFFKSSQSLRCTLSGGSAQEFAGAKFANGDRPSRRDGPKPPFDGQFAPRSNFPQAVVVESCSIFLQAQSRTANGRTLKSAKQANALDRLPYEITSGRVR